MNNFVFFIGTLLIGFVFSSCSRSDHQYRTGPSDPPLNAAAVYESDADARTANSAARIYEKPEIPVLCYHRLSDGGKGEYTVRPAVFASHIKILADSGYHSISPAQLYDYLVFDAVLPEKPVLITFDDSRAEHAVIAAPVLEQYGFKGVFFIMTITYNKKNYMSTDQLARLAAAGHTVGLHSWDHTMVTKYSEAADWQKQVSAPKEKLETITGIPVDCWAYPNGVYDHAGAVELGKYFKLSFILATTRDSVVPLQTIRRIIVPEWTPHGLLQSMHRTFRKKI